jgi:hypothetical protein
MAVVLGFYGTVPEDPPDPLLPGSIAISPWYVVVGQAGVEASHGDDVPRIDDIAGSTEGFVGVYFDVLNDKESECHLVMSSDGVAWLESDLDCPAMSGSLETVGDDIYFTHEFRLWRLAGNTWVEGAIDMSPFSDFVNSSNSLLGFRRGATDGNGLTSFTGRVVFHASRTIPRSSGRMPSLPARPTAADGRWIIWPPTETPSPTALPVPGGLDPSVESPSRIPR